VAAWPWCSSPGAGRRGRRIGHPRPGAAGPRVVDLVVVAVLLPLGAGLVVTRLSRSGLVVGKVAEGAGDAGEWCRTVPW